MSTNFLAQLFSQSTILLFCILFKLAIWVANDHFYVRVLYMYMHFKFALKVIDNHN